ncbi:unnamed protein product [Schistosoma curassoni]|nr:unnamed protein product [Schistosoma curassoni]
MLLGDGVGPELLSYVKEVFQVIGAPIDFEEVAVNQESEDVTFTDALLAMKRNDVGIKGNFATEPGQSSRNVALRLNLNLTHLIVKKVLESKFKGESKQVGHGENNEAK